MCLGDSGAPALPCGPSFLCPPAPLCRPPVPPAGKVVPIVPVITKADTMCARGPPVLPAWRRPMRRDGAAVAAGARPRQTLPPLRDLCPVARATSILSNLALPPPGRYERRRTTSRRCGGALLGSGIGVWPAPRTDYACARPRSQDTQNDACTQNAKRELTQTQTHTHTTHTHSLFRCSTGCSTRACRACAARSTCLLSTRRRWSGRA